MPLPTCVYSTEIQFESKKLEKKRLIMVKMLFKFKLIRCKNDHKVITNLSLLCYVGNPKKGNIHLCFVISKASQQFA